MERRDVDDRVELRENDEGGAVLVGLAAVYYDGTAASEYPLTSRAVERIAPGAFDEALEAGGDVLGRWNHDELLGRLSSGTLRLRADARGLWYEIDLGETSTARDVAEHVRRGDVSGSSFAFRVTSEDWTEAEEGGRVREIRGVDLVDVGPVVSPAYAATSAGLRAVEISAEARSRIEAAREEVDAGQVDDLEEEGASAGPSAEAIRARARAVAVILESPPK